MRRLVEVWRFLKGNEGEMDPRREVIERVVRRRTLYVPVRDGCTSRTMAWETLLLVEHEGKTYEVQEGSVLGGDKSVFGYIQVRGA